MRIIVNGGIREKQGKFILTIYSSPFARYLLLNAIDRVNLEFLSGDAIVSPGSIKKITIERKKEEHPICVACVGKLIPNYFKDRIRKIKRQLPLKVILRDIISNENLLEYNNRINYAEPKKYDLKTPKSQLMRVGCHISCFRQRERMWYRFNIRHRVLEEIVKKGLKIDICRIKNEFFIKNNPNGNKFNFYKDKKKVSLAYMQISPKFLKNKEITLFAEKRRAISFKAYLCWKDFGLDISQFFLNKEERELAQALMEKNIAIKIPEMGKREADIILPEINGQIELTRIKPVNTDKSKNNAHSEGVHINARLCEGFLRVKKNKINKFFVILHKDWITCKWVKDICELIKPNVIAIPTNFKGNWAEQVVNDIKLEIKK